MRIELLAQSLWYRNNPAGWLLWPLSLLFGAVSALRRLGYRHGLLHSLRLPVPVIVVGNISVGGVGKTPLVIALVEFLREAGYRPGVVSRGYGRRSRATMLLRSDSDARECGDEPLLIARRTACPVAVGADRGRAAQLLLDRGVTVIISDDGLQHYALQRDIEIVVVDGNRRFGNGRLLPSGPLRESPARLASVDLVLFNGGSAQKGELVVQAVLGDAVRLTDGELRSLRAFAKAPVYAVAGIGNPERFFSALRDCGLEVDARPFADHHRFEAEDFAQMHDRPVLMTEKDAVKCADMASVDIWAVPLSVELPDAARQRLSERLEQIGQGA